MGKCCYIFAGIFLQKLQKASGAFTDHLTVFSAERHIVPVAAVFLAIFCGDFCKGFTHKTACIVFTKQRGLNPLNARKGNFLGVDGSAQIAAVNPVRGNILQNGTDLKSLQTALGGKLGVGLASIGFG